MKFVPRGTVEWGGGFPASFQDAMILGGIPATLCRLISGCPGGMIFNNYLKWFIWRICGNSPCYNETSVWVSGMRHILNRYLCCGIFYIHFAPANHAAN